MEEQFHRTPRRHDTAINLPRKLPSSACRRTPPAFPWTPPAVVPGGSSHPPRRAGPRHRNPPPVLRHGIAPVAVDPARASHRHRAGRCGCRRHRHHPGGRGQRQPGSRARQRDLAARGRAPCRGGKHHRLRGGAGRPDGDPRPRPDRDREEPRDQRVGAAFRDQGIRQRQLAGLRHFLRQDGDDEPLEDHRRRDRDRRRRDPQRGQPDLVGLRTFLQPGGRRRRGDPEQRHACLECLHRGRQHRRCGGAVRSSTRRAC